MGRLNCRKLRGLALGLVILLSFQPQAAVPMRTSVFGRCFRRAYGPRTFARRQTKVMLRNGGSVSQPAKPEGMGVKDGVAVIAGSALGGGFLALPLVTAPLGLTPSLVGLGIAWAFIAALCSVYAEVSAQTLQDKAAEVRNKERLLVEDEGGIRRKISTGQNTTQPLGEQSNEQDDIG